MKVLFLDHDGVISLSTDRLPKDLTRFDSRFDEFDIKAVRVLNEILEETDCEIVVTSDWRHECDLQTMQKMYETRGIRKTPIDYTGYVPGTLQQLARNRANEILDFVKSFPPDTAWCAVDDLDLTEWLGENFVYAKRMREGIKQNGIKAKVIKALNKNNLQHDN